MKYGPNKWDERFGVDEYVYGKEPNLFLKQNVNVIPQGKILCVADGEGRNGVWLAKKGYDVTSIDFSPNAIEKTNRLAQESDVSIITVCADLLDYDFGKNQYDGIVSIYSHFKIDDAKTLHEKYYEALKSNGIIFIEAFAKEQLPLQTGGPKDIDLLYDIKSISVTFPQMETIELRKDVIWLHEGELHDGKAVVVRAILKKSSQGRE